MSDIEDDVYYDAISTGDRSKGGNGRNTAVPQTGDSSHGAQTDNRDLKSRDSQSPGSSVAKEPSDVISTHSHNDTTSKDYNGMRTIYQPNSVTKNKNHTVSGINVQPAGKECKSQGRVSQLASQFLRKGADNPSSHSAGSAQTASDANLILQKIHELDIPSNSQNKPAADDHKRAFVVNETQDGNIPSAYCFAKPFPEDVADNVCFSQPHTSDTTGVQGQTANEGQEHTEGQRRVESLIDSIGYSHPNKFVEKEETFVKQAEVTANDKESDLNKNEVTLQNQSNSPDELHVVHDIPGNMGHVEKVFENDFEHIEEDNLYDSVHNSLDNRSGPTSGGFEIINHEHVAISRPMASSSPEKKHSTGRTGEKKKMKKLAEDVNYEWKRQQAKKKSRALKRPSKTDKEGNPFTQHHHFDDPHKGAIPEAEDEAVGHFNPFNLDSQDSDSGSSCFTDSTFDSTSDTDQDNEDFFPDKPLPPKPKKDHQLKEFAHKMLPGHQKKESDDGSPILETVRLNRRREPPALPENTGSITQNQVKLRGVLQSLIDSERNYITSLERLTNDYKEPIVSQIKKSEVKVTFQKVDEIASIHKMFQIEFSEKLKKWNTDEEIGSIFHVFSQRMVIDIYSDYVNNYEAATEHIREMENSKQSFKEFLKKKQMESVDRLSLPGLMLKPVQRFPQFIMIIKDLLKYSPRDHHDREPLQEAVTWIENVAHQLNERKRQSEQYFHGQQIMNKLTPRMHPEKNVYLIRQDNMEQLSQGFREKLRVILLNKSLVVFGKEARRKSILGSKDQDGINSERFTYKWHQSLRDLDLTTSAITPNMQTTVNIGNTSSTIMSPKTERSEEDPYDVASELTDMMRDISVLAKINQMVSTLKFSYPGLSEDNLHGIITKLQKEIQSKDYQLQMLNSSTIIVQDKVRKRKYVFSATNANVKQEWCIDFLLSKYAQDVVNIPSWHKPDSTDPVQPALLMRHMSVDMQRTFTRVSCGVKVYFPRKNEGSMEHLWICSSTEGHGQVSVVSLHTDKPSLIESFQATKCMVICAESVPGYARVKKKAAFEEDTVWMSTTDSEIQVFMLSEKQADLHRRCVYTFELGCIVISMKYIDDLVFCGNRTGKLIIFSRNDDGVWSESRRITLGVHPITSLICVGDNMWAACGINIFIIDIDSYEIQGKVEHQLVKTDDNDKHFEYLVKTGVGVWASFIGQPNICLYHSESRRLLQDFNICTAVHDFIKVYSGVEERKYFQVSCLMASLGLLWVGTNVGIILVYPLPRLRDGVPRINERPQVALHSHSGAVKFLLPMHYGPVSGAPIRRRMESVLKKYRVDDSVIKHLSVVEENDSAESRPNSYVSLDAAAMAVDNVYEDVEFQGYKQDNDSQIYEEIPCNKIATSEIAKEGPKVEQTEAEKVEDQESELIQSDEHKYFILEPQTSDTKQVCEMDKSDVNEGGIDRTDGFEHVSMRPKSKNKNIDIQRQSHRNFEIDRRSMTLSFDATYERKSVAFQSELKHALKRRQSLEDLTDRDLTQDEVGNLYPTLLRPRMISNPAKSLRDSYYATSLPDISEPRKESLYRRPFMSSAIEAKKPDFSSTRSLNKESKKKGKKSSTLSKQETPPKEKRRSVSFNKDATMENKRKSSVGTSFSQGSSVDTLRKQDTNTIMVISGGDGYKDWKKRQSLPNYRPEEPCLIFWMYKF
ncbi:uncharacterized protein LOC123527069 isoform X2 [Mercenaria mercenaria]|uniref:uncharacterized protein LOC123527069 isoform X2 n=1 Tax=Mercenaria mercenaria TaxID=6596 RepID=UPI00234F33D4|nr:uncharacterized protein LOC123527069 isoform X2 [Mercenaria mercenaria]